MKIDANAVGKVEGYVGKKKILYFAYILLPTRFAFFYYLYKCYLGWNDQGYRFTDSSRSSSPSYPVDIILTKLGIQVGSTNKDQIMVGTWFLSHYI